MAAQAATGCYFHSCLVLPSAAHEFLLVLRCETECGRLCMHLPVVSFRQLSGWQSSTESNVTRVTAKPRSASLLLNFRNKTIASCTSAYQKAEMDRTHIALVLLFSAAVPTTSSSIAGVPKHIETLSSWLFKPRHQLDVSASLPSSRPRQPWPYRSSAAATSLQITDTHALEASVSHAVVHGVSLFPGQRLTAQALYVTRASTSGSNSRAALGCPKLAHSCTCPHESYAWYVC